MNYKNRNVRLQLPDININNLLFIITSVDICFYIRLKDNFLSILMLLNTTYLVTGWIAGIDRVVLKKQIKQIFILGLNATTTKANKYDNPNKKNHSKH